MSTTFITPTSSVSTEDILRFIECYRDFERLPLKDGYALITAALKTYPGHEHQVSHLCDHWRWKKREFGAFWLNLDYRLILCFLKYWYFDVEGADAYVNRIDTDARSAMFLEPPVLAKTLRDVVLFFGNHSLDVSTFIDLLGFAPVPPAKNRFGNGTNWGKAILDFNRHHPTAAFRLITTIRDYYPNEKLKNQKA